MERRKKRRQRSPESPKLDIAECIAENMTFAASLKAKYIKIFVSIIKAMNFISNTEMQLSRTGLKYVVEESKSFQTAAYVKKEFFDTFDLKMPDSEVDVIGFGVNLTNFTDLSSAFLDNGMSSMNIVYYHNRNCISFTCVQIDSGETFGNKTKQPNYDDEEEEPAGEINSEYFVRTMESVNPIDFNVVSPKLLNSLLLDAFDFFEVINDFDRTIEEIEIKITDRRMTLRSVGVLQCVSVMKIPSNSEVFSKFECFEPTKFIYKFLYFKVMLKALLLSSKMSFITHADGMLKIQLMVKAEDEQETSAFIEYNMIPSLPDDDDEENE